MKFKKTELDFLKVFTQVADTHRVINDKLKIKAKGKHVIFSLFSDFGTVIYSLDKTIQKEFEVIYPVHNFYSFVRLLKEDSELEIMEGKIRVNSDSEYQFDSYDIPIGDESKYLKLLEKEPSQKFVLKNINLLKLAKNFVGSDDLDTVMINKGHFVASNKQIACILPTENNVKNIYLPSAITILLNAYGTDQLELSIYPEDKDTVECVFFDLLGIKVFSAVNKFNLPDLLSDKLKEIYDHDYSMSLKKESLEEVLSRMKIVTSLNVNSRVTLSVGPKKIKIENKDYNKSFEEVSFDTCDKELIGTKILLNCDTLSKLIDHLDGDFVSFYMKNEDMVAIKIEDETHKNKFVQVLVAD